MPLTDMWANQTRLPLCLSLPTAYCLLLTVLSSRLPHPRPRLRRLRQYRVRRGRGRRSLNPCRTLHTTQRRPCRRPCPRARQLHTLGMFRLALSSLPPACVPVPEEARPLAVRFGETSTLS